MTRISTGTVSVGAGGTVVTAWSGDDGVVLSEITAPAASSLVIEGAANFIKQRLSTTSFELLLPHVGAGGADLPCAISALTATETSVGTLNARTATVIQQLSVLDANGRGLFYNLIGVTGENDPGPGNMALNNADPDLVSEVYLDVLDANEGGRDVSGLIDLWAASSIIIVRSLATTAYAAFQVAGTPVVAAGYRKVPVSYVDHDGTLADEPVAIEWRLAGRDKDMDVQVPNLAGRAAYNGAATGFRVRVENVGDGRSAVYVKRSNASGDWSGPAYFTGPVGPTPVVQIGNTQTLAPGSNATVTPTPIAGGISLAFGIPAGEGFYWFGQYNPASAYVKSSVVRDNNSTWISLQAVPAGQTPPVLPTVNNAYWTLLAAKGQDGNGTGDFVGPANAAVNGIVGFADTTGKLGKQLTPAQGRAAIEVSVLTGFRNKLINGDFNFWQRGTVFGSANGYTADRWNLSPGSGNTSGVQRGVFVPSQHPEEDAFYLTWSRSVATSTAYLYQPIEDVRTLAGKKVTATFYASANANTELRIYLAQVFGSGGAPSAAVILSPLTVALTAAHVKFSMTFDLPTLAGKTIGTDNNSYLQFVFQRDHTATNPLTAVHISHVSLVEGDTTQEREPFSRRHIAQEASLCERYYQILAGYQRYLASAAGNWSETIPYRTLMRAAPTVVLGGAPISSNATAESITGSSIFALRWAMQSQAAGDCYILGREFRADAEL
jgi:hypothetical protein